MTTPRPLLAVGVAAIAVLILAPIVFDDDTALVVAVVVTALFLVVYALLRGRGRPQS